MPGTSEKTSPFEESLRARLAEHLPDVMVPRAWVLLERLPETVNGKIDRAALPAPARGPASRPPSTDTEIRVARLVERVLGVEAPGAEDDFFDLGGHSLKIITLLDATTEAFGHAPPLAAFYEAPTIAALAAHLERFESAASSPLVELQGEGSLPPLVLVHDVTGTAWPLRELARRLGPEQPVYGLQAAGLLAGERPVDDLSEMARRYVEALRAVYPNGPYALGGYSIGGAVALEMAHRLTAAGERVELLAVLDGHLPESVQTSPVEDQASGIGATQEASSRARLRAVIDAHRAAFAAYRPRPYAGRTLLIAAGDAEPGVAEAGVAEAQHRAWSAVAPIRRVVVPGDHRQVPGREETARAIAEELRRVRANQAPAEQPEPVLAGEAP